MESIIKAILGGEADDSLPNIIDAARTRQKLLAATLKYTLKVGDRVRFNQEARPKYLVGVEATVTQILPSNLDVTIDQPVGKFHNRIRTSPRLIEAI